MKSENSKAIKYFYVLSLFVIFVFAIFIRIKSNLDYRPLWHDEAFVALTVIKNNIFKIFFETEYNMKAPFLFWIGVKCSGILFGYKELPLRIYPLICSVISVFVFYFFSKAFLTNRFIIIIANILFAVNFRLLYYSQELKQYSGDVLFFMLALLIFPKLAESEFGKKHALYFVLFGIFAVLASFPASFVVIAFIVYKLFNLKKIEIKYFFSGSLIILIAAAAYYFCFIDRLYSREIEIFYDYWQEGFITVQNLFIVLKKIYIYNFTYCRNYILGLALCFAGLVLIIKEKHTLNKILLISLIIIAAASILAIYPLYGRVQIYLIPVFIVFILKIADIHYKRIIYFILAISIIFVNFAPVFNKYYIKYITSKNIFESWNGREIVKLLKDSNGQNDTILVNKDSQTQFEYYSIYYNFSLPDVLYYDFSKKAAKEFEEYANSLASGKHYWFINISSRNQENQYLLDWKTDSKNIITEYEYIIKRSYAVKLEKKY